MSTELGGMWQTSERTGLRERVKVGRHIGRFNAQARLTRLAVEQRWQHRAEELHRIVSFRVQRNREERTALYPLDVIEVERANERAHRTRLAASQRARKVGGLAF